jgi:hypothetical protein
MSAVNKLFNLKMPGLAQAVPVLAVFMEIFWSYAWLVWLSSLTALGWAHPPLNLWSCILQALFSEVLSRYALSRKWSLKRVRLVVLPSSLILLLLLVRLNLGGGYMLWDGAWINYAGSHIAELAIGLVFGVFLTWRGLSVGGQRNSFREVYNRFLVGLVAIILLLILWGMTGGQIANISSSAAIYTLLFFGTGLLGMATANLEALRIELLQHQEAAGSFNRRWVSMLVALVLVILGIGIAFAAVFSSDLASTLVHALGTFGDWLLTAFIYLLYPVAFLAAGLYYVARWILSLITHGQPPEPPQMNGMADLKDLVQGESTVQIPEGVLIALKWLLVLLVAGLVIFFLARIIIRYSQSKTSEDIEEVHETLWSWGLFSADLRALLAWLFRWARRKERSGTAADAPVVAVPLIEEDTGRIYSIRELYRAWLWQAGQRWSPRRRSETAYEYRRRLGESVEKVADEVDTLTEAYMQERYSQEKTPEDRLKLLNRLWHNLRSKLSNPDPKE